MSQFEPKVTVLFEDAWVLVVSKPTGMVVNDSEHAGNSTLQQWLYHYLESELQQYSEEIDSDFYRRAGYCHRLDKETSGCLVVAKDPESFAQILRQFKQRKVEKTYTALVHGKLEPRHGNVHLPIRRSLWNRQMMQVAIDGKDAYTDYEIMDYFCWNGELYSLVKLMPKTGRTHQIRVHMSFVHHPLVADKVYASSKLNILDEKLLSRHFLHASSILFRHPVKETPVSVMSELDDDLQQVVEMMMRGKL